MSNCTDRKIGRLLHHYELGLLSDEDRRRFEMHLLECDICFEDVRQFRQQALLMKNDNEVKYTINEIAKGSGFREPAIDDSLTSTISIKNRFWRVIPVFAVIAAIALVLILHPFRFDSDSDMTAIAAENRLAVIYFSNLENSDDPERLAEILTNLLITDLSESKFIHVLSGQRLHDILRLLGREGIKVIDPDLATAVAEKWDAKWVLKGSILQTKPHMEVTVQLVEATSGITLAAWRLTGLENESIFFLADRLSSKIKENLPLPSAAKDEKDNFVADVTTHSQEAYYHYLEGIDLLNAIKVCEAETSFRKALDHDSTFAMAYYQLSLLGKSALIEKAMKYIGTVSLKEKYYIRSRYALFQKNRVWAISELEDLLRRYPEEKAALFILGRHYSSVMEYEKAVQYLKTVIDIDPLYKLAYNELAYTYDKSGQFDEALSALDTYAALAPDEPNPHDTRGYIQARNGKFQEAEQSYKKALEIDPNFWSSQDQLLMLYFFTRDYSKITNLTNIIRNDSNIQCWFYCRIVPVIQAIHRGQFRRAIANIDTLRNQYSDSLSLVMSARMMLTKALLLNEINDADGAIEILKEVEELLIGSRFTKSHGYRHYQVYLLSLSGKTDQAETILREFKSDLGDSDEFDYAIHFAQGAIAMSKGDFSKAINELKDMTEPVFWFTGSHLLAQVYLAAGQSEKASAIFEKCLNDISEWRMAWTLWDVKTHYYLGLAYEKTGKTKEAINQFEIFVELFKDADTDIREFDDARGRLIRLKNNP